ncbi:MAG: GGDEF domain-containing protein [Candidatus Aenigmarchaeota archaeon]|nr:GGDEF domain-containing protein [Candidatus Aenigmarchaeota archaeon]
MTLRPTSITGDWTGTVENINYLADLVREAIRQGYHFPEEQVKLLETDTVEYAGRLHRRAVTDPLTGVSSAAYLQERGADLIDNRQHPDYVSLMRVDFDNLKTQVNDKLGHAAGDAVLRVVGRILQQVAADDLRDTDVRSVYGREGGGADEFVGLLPETDTKGSRIVGERIRTAYTQYRDLFLDLYGNRPDDPETLGPEATEALRNTSLSVGIVTAREGTYAGLKETADELVYRAKRRGKNRVVVAEERELPRQALSPGEEAEYRQEVADARQPLIPTSHTPASARPSSS